jgi:hypothetical protein
MSVPREVRRIWYLRLGFTAQEEKRTIEKQRILISPSLLSVPVFPQVLGFP